MRSIAAQVIDSIAFTELILIDCNPIGLEHGDIPTTFVPH
jgi:hypothetical protein